MMKLKSYERIALVMECYWTYATIDSMNDAETKNTLKRLHNVFINRWNAHVRETFEKFRSK